MAILTSSFCVVAFVRYLAAVDCLLECISAWHCSSCSFASRSKNLPRGAIPCMELLRRSRGKLYTRANVRIHYVPPAAGTPSPRSFVCFLCIIVHEHLGKLFQTKTNESFLVPSMIKLINSDGRDITNDVIIRHYHHDESAASFCNRASTSPS